jgi:coproporphyrinogen III oxidase
VGYFDYCKANEEQSMQDWFNFVSEVGDSFLEAYVPIVEKRKGLAYTPEHKTWQEIRRGRYVEFNLVHDKGTLFGLKPTVELKVLTVFTTKCTVGIRSSSRTCEEEKKS